MIDSENLAFFWFFRGQRKASPSHQLRFLQILHCIMPQRAPSESTVRPEFVQIRATRFWQA